MSEFTAFYERLDATTYVATDATESPWDARLQHGSPPTALLAHVINALHPRDDVRTARVAAEFLGPIPKGRLHVRAELKRPGKRIEMLEGAIESDGRDVVLMRLWRIAAGTAGSVAPARTVPDAVPPRPVEATKLAWLERFGYGRAVEWRNVYGLDVPGPAAVWARPRVPLIAGEALVPLDYALLIADSANGTSAELSLDEWLFVPPSLSVALERHPVGEWVLLEARTTLSEDGLGLSASRLGDERGYFGVGSQPLLVERRR